MQDTQNPTVFNSFRRAAQSGEFLVTAEVAPPKGVNVGHMISMAATLKGGFMLSILPMVAALYYECLL